MVEQRYNKYTCISPLLEVGKEKLEEKVSPSQCIETEENWLKQCTLKIIKYLNHPLQKATHHKEDIEYMSSEYCQEMGRVAALFVSLAA